MPNVWASISQPFFLHGPVWMLVVFRVTPWKKCVARLCSVYGKASRIQVRHIYPWDIFIIRGWDQSKEILD
ncbi:hypothetical protein KPH14_011125 [Odynerus spinipes]|uniref:Uncharacterized protein n=1 Tax=Odynerus spinipes TaxID=1348599 RepID=A0AAD9VL86_9HYME|nr:hypothetical protein KPH14_011125 [Odynerus spinipes]